MTHPLSARLMLLAAATCLALSLVWAMVAAEIRDGDGAPAGPAKAAEGRPAAEGGTLRVEARP